MKTLFLKSNLLHIRTNEGEFEVSNPEVVHTSPLVQFHRKWNEGDEVEWPYCVELIVSTEGVSTKAVARLLPKEEFKPAQPTPNFPKGGTTFTESAYKEGEMCPDCGYSIEDARINMDHHLCKNKDFFKTKPVESSEPQEKRCKACEIERNDEQVKQMPEHTCKKESLMDIALPKSAPSESQDGLLEIFSIHRYSDGRVEGYRNGELIKPFDTLGRLTKCPSESQEELWQSSNPNKERYVQLSNVHSDGMPEPWLRLWEQIEIWYGDIQKRETGVQLLERLRKEGFKITRNP